MPCTHIGRTVWPSNIWRIDSQEAAPAVARRGRRGPASGWSGSSSPLVVPDRGCPVRDAGRILAGALAILVWWLFFSRAPWSERLGALVLMIVAVFATSRLVHVSIAEAGMGILLFFVLAVPVLSLALVAWAVASRRLPDGPRRAVAGRRPSCRVRRLHARPDRWHQRRGGSGPPLAVDGDSRGTAPGPGRRRRRRPAPPPPTPVEPPVPERPTATRLRRRLRRQ